jgi:predicted DNA-binding transcriptional regulator YafY
VFRYTNWCGETSIRRATPIGPLTWSSNQWHPQPCWMFPAFDHDKGANRTFRLEDCDFTVGDEATD